MIGELLCRVSVIFWYVQAIVSSGPLCPIVASRQEAMVLNIYFAGNVSLLSSFCGSCTEFQVGLVPLLRLRIKLYIYISIHFHTRHHPKREPNLTEERPQCAMGSQSPRRVLTPLDCSDCRLHEDLEKTKRSSSQKKWKTEIDFLKYISNVGYIFFV